jgi:hypothetical protein
VSLKPAHILQLAEAGANSHDDLAAKVVDMVEQGALAVGDEDTRALVRVHGLKRIGCKV